MRDCKGRFAPTPSGDMHIGNAFCYFLAWLSARSQSGRIVLRFEDCDRLRMQPEAVGQTMSDLEWLGLCWDEGPAPGQAEGPYFQSCRTAIYDRVFEELRARRLVYPCFCSRQDVRLAAAPHPGEDAPVYPGTCRDLSAAEIDVRMKKRAPAWRLRLEDKTVCFCDALLGPQRCKILSERGDFPVRRADGVYCYQFTAALDDALMGVSEVVRSNDLLASTPWQIYLQQLLGYTPPTYLHIPLLLDENGSRLAKREKSLSLRQIRRHYTPEEVIGKLAFLAGLQSAPESCDLAALAAQFSAERLPREDIVLPPTLFSACRET